MRKNQIVHWHRYYRFLRMYGTAKKLGNLASMLYQYQRGFERVRGYPSFLKIEVCRFCTVSCRYCEKTKENVLFPYHAYTRLIDKLKDFIFGVSLYDIGEPLHHPELLKYVRYAHARRVGTVISTSLSVQKPDDYWKDVVNSGLDRLIVAIDGTSESVYRKYRTNGDFALVMRNLRAILDYRRSSKSNLLVEWQMLDLEWNKHEQPNARLLAKKLGVDSFKLKPEENTIRLEYEKLGVIRRRNCLLPYLVYIVDAYGRARPCYKVYTNDVFVGDTTKNDFEAIWNGDEMFRIRNRSKISSRSPCMTCLE